MTIIVTYYYYNCGWNAHSIGWPMPPLVVSVLTRFQILSQLVLPMGCLPFCSTKVLECLQQNNQNGKKKKHNKCCFSWGTNLKTETELNLLNVSQLSRHIILSKLKQSKHVIMDQIAIFCELYFECWLYAMFETKGSL